jgi:hypothetical protein
LGRGADSDDEENIQGINGKEEEEENPLPVTQEQEEDSEAGQQSQRHSEEEEEEQQEEDKVDVGDADVIETRAPCSLYAMLCYA